MQAAREPSELLERGTELSALDAAIAAAERRQGCALMIEGPAGIGKTRLLAAAAARAGPVTVLSARADDLERGYPWGVARQLFDRALMDGDGEALFDGAASLAAPAVGLEFGAHQPEGWFTALHGLYWLTANLAERGPLIIAVDDLHWADVPSLRYLVYLVRRIEGMPIAVLATVRTGEAPAETHGLLDRLRADESVRRLHPAPLSAAATSVIVRAQVGETVGQRLCDACHEVTGGNPFLLSELLRELGEAGSELDTHAAAERVRRLSPDVVSRSVLLRLARLPVAALSTARAVAVLGAVATSSRVAAVAELPRDVVAEAARALIAAEILAGEEETLQYVHPIVRAAVYDDLSRPELDSWHMRAARVLAKAGASPEEVAAHLLAAAPSGDPWGVSVLRAAAKLASQRGALDAAARYLRRALLEPPAAGLRAELLLELGVAETAEDPAQACQHLGEAIELADEGQVRAQIGLALGHAMALLGRFADAAGVLERAIPEASEKTPLEASLQAEFLNAARWDLSTRPRCHPVLARLAERAADGEQLDPRLQVQLAIEDAVAGRNLELALERAQHSLGDPALLLPAASTTFPQAVSVLLLADHVQDARRAANIWLRVAQQRGWPLLSALAANVAAFVAMQAGAVSDAVAYARESLAPAADVWIPPIGVAFLLEPLAARGECAAALDELATRSLDGELPPAWPFLVVRYFRGRLHAASGNHRQAVADLLPTGELCEAWGVRSPAFVPWRSSAAESLTVLGERDEALRLARDELALAETIGTNRAIGVALRALGNAEPDGIATLATAVATLEQSSAPLELARALADLGAALRRAGRRTDARKHLSRALDLAHHLGALAVAEHARDELVIAGARPRRNALRGRDALTASELRVARMAREGLTNREIAEALFLTLRTVEHHLTATYAKLGIASRDQLAALDGPPQDDPGSEEIPGPKPGA